MRLRARCWEGRGTDYADILVLEEDGMISLIKRLILMIRLPERVCEVLPAS